MKNVLIIGLGEFGKLTAKRFKELKNEVCIFDIKPEIINSLDDEFDNAYIGDCMNKQTLKEIGVKNFDICIVAVGSNFQASLEITSNLKECGAQYIVAKASSDLQSKFLIMAGANETVNPEKDLAEKIAVKYNAQDIFDYIQLSKDYNVFEIKVQKTWIDKTVKEVDLRNKFQLNIIAIKTSTSEIILPDKNYIFQSGDHLYVFGKDEDVFKLEKRIK